MGATAEAEAEAEAEDVADAQDRQGDKAKAGAGAPRMARLSEEKVRVPESLQRGGAKIAEAEDEIQEPEATNKET